MLARHGPTFVFGLAGDGPPPAGVAGWRHASDPRAARTATGEELTAALQAGRSPFATVTVPSAITDLREFVAAVAPDVAVVCGFELAAYLDVLRPLVGTLVLDLDYPQARTVDEMARADTNRRRGFVWRRALEAVARDEADATRIVDQVWVAAPDDADRIAAETGYGALVAVVPNVVDVGQYERAARSDRNALVYTARFDFWPNEEAARTLVHEIMPRLPDASLALVGIAPPRWLRELDDPRVTVTGAVPDVRPYLASASAMPVPLTAGSGTRIKVLEAFASGVPVVSTAKGVEGLGLVADQHYLQAEHPDAFARAIRCLDDDPVVAQHCVDEAMTLVHREFSLAALHDAVMTALDPSASSGGAG